MLEKLYMVPRNSVIEVSNTQLLFHHIDGAYSYCTDVNGNVHHISAFADVKLVSDRPNDF